MHLSVYLIYFFTTFIRDFSISYCKELLKGHLRVCHLNRQWEIGRTSNRNTKGLDLACYRSLYTNKIHLYNFSYKCIYTFIKFEPCVGRINHQWNFSAKWFFTTSILAEDHLLQYKFEDKNSCMFTRVH